MVIISIFRPFTMRRHLDQLGIELAKNRHEVSLRIHDFVDILVDHRHLIQSR